MSFEDGPTDPDVPAPKPNVPKKAVQEFEFSLDPESEKEAESETPYDAGPSLTRETPETRAQQPVPAHFDLSFQPPPRPELLTESLGPTPGSIQEEDINDPALTLFNAIQTVRERRSQPINPAPVKDFGRKKSLFKLPTMRRPEVISRVMPKVAAVRAAIPPVPARLWWTAIAAGILLGSISWGVIRLLKNHGQSGAGSLTQVKTEPTGVFHPSETRPKSAERHNPMAAAPSAHQPPPPPPASKPNEAEPKDPRDNENPYPPVEDREANGNEGNLGQPGGQPGAPLNQPVPNQLPNQRIPNPNNPYLNANPYGQEPNQPNEQAQDPMGGVPAYPGINDKGAFTPPPAPQTDPNTGAPVIANPGNNPYLQENQGQPQDPNAAPPAPNAPGQDAFPPPQQ
jgi:hypothetical protein